MFFVPNLGNIQSFVWLIDVLIHLNQNVGDKFSEENLGARRFGIEG